MSWAVEPVAKALAATLESVDPAVSVFAFPPPTLNPPALVVGRPSEVNLEQVAFGVDQATIPIIAFASMDGDITVADLLAGARLLIDADPTLAHEVQATRTLRYTNWRALNVGGADLLAADLIVEVWC